MHTPKTAASRALLSWLPDRVSCSFQRTSTCCFALARISAELSLAASLPRDFILRGPAQLSLSELKFRPILCPAGAVHGLLLRDGHGQGVRLEVEKPFAVGLGTPGSDLGGGEEGSRGLLAAPSLPRTVSERAQEGLMAPGAFPRPKSHHSEDVRHCLA